MINQRQQQIGRRIRTTREEAKLSQEELGAKVGYSAMGISHLEKGDRKIKLDDLQAIARELKVELSYLLEPVIKQTSSSMLYRRGEDEITDEQKRAEQDALKLLDDLVSKM